GARARLRAPRRARPRDRREGGGAREGAGGPRARGVARLRARGRARAHLRVEHVEGRARARAHEADAEPQGARDVVTAQASLERLRASPLPRVLFVAHGGGGGVERHIESLASAIAPNAEVLLLRPHVEGFLELRWLRAGERVEAWFRAVEDW